MALVLCLAALLAPVARGEVVQREGVRISYDARLLPKKLPRNGAAPAAITFGARLTPVRADLPPQLRRLRIALSRHGSLDTSHLQVCPLQRIQPATNAEALHACGRSQIGEGRFGARILLTDQAPFPSRGRVLAFYGRYRGRAAILAHVYGTDPAPVSYTVPFLLRRTRGAFGTVLTASFERSLGEAGYITLLQMTLGGRFGYVRASCPTQGASSLFPLAALSIGFPDQRLSSTLMRSCQVR